MPGGPADEDFFAEETGEGAGLRWAPPGELQSPGVGSVAASPSRRYRDPVDRGV